MLHQKDIDPLQKRLQNHETNAPDFNDLFASAMPDDIQLRSILRSKLAQHSTIAPPYEAFPFTSATVNAPTKSRYSVWWQIPVSIAAGLALWLMIPSQLQKNDGLERTGVLQMESPSTSEAMTQTISRSANTRTATIQTKDIHLATLDVTETEESIATQTDTTDSYQPNTQTGMTKLAAGRLHSLHVNKHKYEAIYAQASASRQSNRGKSSIGLDLTGGSRLLSFVNSNSLDAAPMIAGVDQVEAGLNAIENHDALSLRAANSSKNEWKAPHNIPVAALTSYEASYALPINLGVSYALPLSSLFELQTGLQYSYLSGRTTGMTGSNHFELRQALHYLGIPMKLALQVHHSNHLRLYVAFGGTIEKGLVGTQRSTVTQADGTQSVWRSSQAIQGLQSSVSGQIGLEYRLSKNTHVYAEPGANYFFDNEQPISTRTVEPFNFNVSIGLRYRLN